MFELGWNHLRFVVLLAVAASPVRLAAAPLYEFVRISDTESFALLQPPAINNSGSVAFFGASIPTTSAWGYYVAEPGAAPVQISANPPGTSGERASISNSGNVLFLSTVPGHAQSLVLASTSGLTTVYDTLGIVQAFGSFPDVNAADEVAFNGTVNGFGDGMFRGNGGPVTPIALNSDDPGVTFYTHGDPAINDSGLVAFAACTSLGCDSSPGAQTILSGGGQGLVPMLPDPNEFNFIAQLPAINGLGVVAFYASLVSTGQQGMFTTDGLNVVTIALNGGELSPDSGSFAINDLGQVVFRATLTSGGDGLFLGPDVTSDRIIGTGDSLFGSVVSHLEMWRGGLNDRGQVAFYATLADGTRGIFVATPVPEPGSILLILGAGIVLGGFRLCEATNQRGSTSSSTRLPESRSTTQPRCKQRMSRGLRGRERGSRAITSGGASSLVRNL